MTKSEINRTTKQWLYFKGFQKGKYNTYACPLDGFDARVLFYKDRFREVYYIDVGFILRDDPNGWGQMRAMNQDSKYWHYGEMADGKKYIEKASFYYEQWNKDDYIQCLDKIYDVYIKPYFELGFELLKTIAKDPTCGGKYGASQENPYFVHPHAVAKILGME